MIGIEPQDLYDKKATNMDCENLYVVKDDEHIKYLMDNDDKFTPISIRRDMQSNINFDEIRDYYKMASEYSKSSGSNGKIIVAIGFSSGPNNEDPIIGFSAEDIVSKMEKDVQFAKQVNYCVIIFFFTDKNDAFAFKLKSDL